jgi:hypothetical protein
VARDTCIKKGRPATPACLTFISHSTLQLRKHTPTDLFDLKHVAGVELKVDCDNTRQRCGHTTLRTLVENVAAVGVAERHAHAATFSRVHVARTDDNRSASRAVGLEPSGHGPDRVVVRAKVEDC